MPTEPNKNAEEELKRYAEERRRQPAPELHPATRRLLQGEVTRTHGRSTEKKTNWRQFLFHPALAAFAGVLLVLAVLQFGSNQPKEETFKELKPTEKPAAKAEADAVANAPTPPASPAPPTVAETKPGARPAEKPAASVAMDALSREETKEARKAPEPILSAASSPSFARAELENLNFSNHAQQSLPFAANVMNKFQLERVGLRGVRFVDQDQSVYTGSVVASRGTTNLFRAQGDNRTLQSPVVITGQYFTVTTLTDSFAQQQTRARAQQTQQPQQQLRLQGQAFVGVTNLIQIEAQSGAPAQ